MQTLHPNPTPPRPELHPAAAPPRPSPREHAGVECWRVERVARYLDISRKRVYQLVQEKKLDAIRLGPRMMRILHPSIERYLAGLMEEES